MRAMVSPALPALTVLTARIERLGQSCAPAAGAKVIRTAHAAAPHHVRNDIDTSLECRRSSDRLPWWRFRLSRFSLAMFSLVMGLRGGRRLPCRPAVRLDGRMMLPIGARTQRRRAPCARASHVEEPHARRRASKSNLVELEDCAR